MRICFFGDSFVNGVGDGESLGWVGRVCTERRRAGCDLTVYNLGIRRDTSADVARRWGVEAAARLPAGQPGALVFSFGANDACPGGEEPVRVPLAATLANAEAILGRARGWHPTLMIGPLPVGDDPAADARVAASCEALAGLCARVGVPYLPVFAAMAACPAWRDGAAAGDGTHPDAGGYAALAARIDAWDAWRATLRPAVQPRFR